MQVTFPVLVGILAALGDKAVFLVGLGMVVGLGTVVYKGYSIPVFVNVPGFRVKKIWAWLNEEDAAIVKTIIVLAKNLNLDVIAEGVETDAQKEFLIKNGCTSIQGYYYDKPLSAEEIREKYL